MIKTKHSKAYFILFRMIQILLMSIFALLYRVKRIDFDKIPRKGKLILCSNHISYLDPVIIAAYAPRCIYFMAKKELYNNRFLGSLVSFLNAFPVNRRTLDRRTISTSFDILKDGNVLGLFPEGTRSTDGILRKGKKGMGFIAAHSKTPVVPVAITGANKIVQKPHKRIYFPKIKIIAGEVIDVKDILRKNSKKEAITIIVEKTMQEIGRIYNKIK
jgi:1-acyl-sn-glycerol-3-phosphate acyltransferase